MLSGFLRGEPFERADIGLFPDFPERAGRPRYNQSGKTDKNNPERRIMTNSGCGAGQKPRADKEKEYEDQRNTVRGGTPFG